MSFAIMRMAKIKSKRDVVMSLQHNTRERMPLNADPEKTKKNLVYGGTTAETMVRFDGLMPQKIRKNAVLAVELVMTASPDFKGHWGAYLKDSLDWALDTFGIDKEKKDIRPAIQYAVHHDEQTPHIHLMVVPLKDGKLNAKHFIGGSRERMAELQQDFFEKVGKKHELERGRPREETRAKHSHHTLATKTAELDARAKELDGKEKKLNEMAEQIKVAAAEIREIRGISAEGIKNLKSDFDNWNKQTPDQLRGLAKVIEGKGYKTVADYREGLAEQRKREREQSRGYGR